jgi:hypothetical protein
LRGFKELRRLCGGWLVPRISSREPFGRSGEEADLWVFLVTKIVWNVFSLLSSIITTIKVRRSFLSLFTQRT